MGLAGAPFGDVSAIQYDIAGYSFLLTIARDPLNISSLTVHGISESSLSSVSSLSSSLTLALFLSEVDIALKKNATFLMPVEKRIKMSVLKKVYLYTAISLSRLTFAANV
jgi:hypothetical protein